MSNDPFVNLSIEHHLFRKTSHGSVILFIYRNRPCVVLGRNQNPWLELNLRECLDLARRGELSIVRRYSGGGTVFHDLGNVNWTIISPPERFTRDKHAEMVVRALRACNVARARVNQRHDIVLDQGSKQSASVNPDDTHRTPWTTTDDSDTRKCSGSAYKLTRGRALHHGTCLLNSHSLGGLKRLLRSPAQSYIKAKGVESVSSKVSNTWVSYEEFREAVEEQFRKMYLSFDQHMTTIPVGEEALDEHGVRRNFEQMQTNEWTYGQTPGFEFGLESSEQAANIGSSIGEHIPMPKAAVCLSVRHGQIEHISIHATPWRLPTRTLYGAHSWRDILRDDCGKMMPVEYETLVKFLYEMLPIASHAP